MLQGRQLGQGLRQNHEKHLTHSSMYETIWKPHLGIQDGFPFTAFYQEYLKKHVFHAACQMLLVLEILDCIPSSVALQCQFTVFEAQGQTPGIVKSDGERHINLSCALEKINLWSGINEAPHYAVQLKSFAQESCGPCCWLMTALIVCSGLAEGST